MKNINEIEHQIGARGSATISGAAGRDLARTWLQCNGVGRDTACRLAMPDINAIYNDVTDAKLDVLRLGAHVPTAATPAANGVDALLEQLRNALTAKPTSGVDEMKVREIAEGVLTPYGVQLEDLENRIKPLMDLAARAAADTTAAKRIPLLAAAASGNHILDKLLPHYKVGTENHVKCLVTAPPSFGKSYSIRKLGTSYDTLIEHGCSEDADEISTLLGNTVPDGKGGFTVFDGKLTQAVREASTGKSVLFFMDEVLRLSDKAQVWLLSFLTGVDTAAGLVYRLTTRRVDATGNLEVVECPATKLHIVAAANLGLVRPIEAFWSRWHKVRLDWNVAECASVATAILNKGGITHKPAFATEWANLMNVTRQTTKTGEINYPVDFRFLVTACHSAKTPDEDGVREFVKDNLLNQVAQWDGDLGDTDRTCEAKLQSFLKDL